MFSLPFHVKGYRVDKDKNGQLFVLLQKEKKLSGTLKRCDMEKELKEIKQMPKEICERLKVLETYSTLVPPPYECSMKKESVQEGVIRELFTSYESKNERLQLKESAYKQAWMQLIGRKS